MQKYHFVSHFIFAELRGPVASFTPEYSLHDFQLGLHVSPHVFTRDQQNQSTFSKSLISYWASEWHNSTIPITRSYASYTFKLPLINPLVIGPSVWQQKIPSGCKPPRDISPPPPPPEYKHPLYKPPGYKPPDISPLGYKLPHICLPDISPPAINPRI